MVIPDISNTRRCGVMDAQRIFVGGGFLAENAEAFGLVSDAHPITTDTLMIAANGHAADDGMHPPTFAVGGKGVEGLYEGLYHDLIPNTPENQEILRKTFGESEGRQNHPIARYSAALTVALAHEVLSQNPQAEAYECAAMLSNVLPDGIDAMRDVMRAAVGPRPGSEHFFSVSFCACRLTAAEQDAYNIDIFHAGDFALYLLSEQGMAPLFLCDSDVLEPLETSMVRVHHIHLYHPQPFMLLLLSKSAYDISVKDMRAIQDTPGLLWRYRMRMEEQWIRLVTNATSQELLAEGAERFFTGRAVGRDSVTGAWMLRAGTFDTVRAACQGRSHQLERLMSLLPKGYDPYRPAQQIPLDKVEEAFILTAFRTRPGLTERVMDVIARLAADKLHDPQETNEEPMYDSIDRPIPHLTCAKVQEIYLSFDIANQPDREQMEKNRQVMRELLSEHWTTLRPMFCRGPMADAPEPHIRQKNDAHALACQMLKRRLSKLVNQRKALMAELKSRLNKSMDILERQGEDWANGVGGGGAAYRWFDEMEHDIPKLVEAVKHEYQTTTHRLRSLHVAYVQERELSFCADVAEGGVWHTCYQRIMEGELPADVWRAYTDDIQANIPSYADYWQVIRTISERNLALRERIESRGAERRMVLTLSGDTDLQVACMLGALWEDSAWGEQIGSLVDNGFRNEYKALRRHWLEEKELLVRQRDAFESYQDMYTAYVEET